MSSASDYTNESSASGAWIRAKAAYFYLLVVLTLAIALASFVRVRGQGLSNISLWIFVVPFALTLVRTRLGLIAGVFLLTIAPALHLQLNAVAGTRLYAWAYPGVDACLGFLLAWVCKGQLATARSVLGRFPVGPLLLFHAWIALSALVAVARNLWQSASEFSLRGLAYNVWLVRGISWLDDYYPLQDLFFYSAALALLFSVWTLVTKEKDRLVWPLVLAVLAGAVLNVAFALWQKLTGQGWADGDLSQSVNALWPDLHSFGAFMAVALFLGYGSFRTQPSSIATKVALSLSMAAAAAGLYLSTSRSTLFIVCVGLVIWGVWLAFKFKGWRRALPLMAIVALVAAIDWTLNRGYRGYAYGSLSALFEGFSADKLNAALSHRPEIWGAAIDMYLAFPLFGLGQGAFYRLSSLPGFSHSEALVGLGGSGAHNYFLQMFVELGPVVLLFGLLLAVAVLKLGKENFRLISFYALLGIAVGNVYAHSLLVRETLMLSAVFGGIYLWEAQALGGESWRSLTPTKMRTSLGVAAVLVLLGFVEVAHSFGSTPFNYGERCFELRTIADDGWANGFVRKPTPMGTARIDFLLSADRQDLERRPLTVELSVLEGEAALWSESLELSQPMKEPRQFTIELPGPPSDGRLLVIKASHCLVPLNLGLTYEPRRLGVRVQELHFFTKDGSEVP
jgi:hypothetical protein